MATKTSASKSSSKSKKRSGSATSRKTLRKTTAPLAMKKDEEEEDKGKKTASAAAASASKEAKDEAKEDKAAPKSFDFGSSFADDAKADDADAKAAKDKDAAKDDAKADDKKQAKDESSARAPAPKSKVPAAPEAKDEAPAASAPVEQAFEPPPPAEESEYAVLLPPEVIGNWDPETPAPPPGKAPPGDSRSFRRVHGGVEEFVLIYRHDSYLITRIGKVGTQGTWTVVEYPHVGSAAHAYAQECSDFTAAGYRDLR